MNITMTTTNPIEKVVKLTDPKEIVDGSEISMTSPDSSETELRFILDKEKYNINNLETNNKSFKSLLSISKTNIYCNS